MIKKEVAVSNLIFEPAKEYMEENLLNIHKAKVTLLPSLLVLKMAPYLEQVHLFGQKRTND